MIMYNLSFYLVFICNSYSSKINQAKEENHVSGTFWEGFGIEVNTFVDSGEVLEHMF